MCAGQAAEDASWGGNSHQTVQTLWEEPWDQEQKGFHSHMVAGKSLPFWASVSLSSKTTKCHLHREDCCADEWETFKSTGYEQQRATQVQRLLKLKIYTLNFPEK